MKRQLTFFAIVILFLANLQSAIGAGPNREAAIPGSIHVVVDADGRLQYYFVPKSTATLKKYLPGKVQHKGQMFPEIDIANLKTDKAATYKVLSETGNVAGYWIGPDSGAIPAPLNQPGFAAWTSKKVGTFNPQHVASYLSAFPIPESEVMDSLREQLLTRAKDLACKSVIRPKEIAVTASLEASVGLIVGGSGTISFQVTWDTEMLCS